MWGRYKQSGIDTELGLRLDAYLEQKQIYIDLS